MARASLEELRLDYEDFLRQRGLPLWVREDSRRKELIARQCTSADAVAAWCKEQHGRDRPSGPDGQAKMSTASTTSMSSTKSTSYPEIAANATLTLIAVACSLLERQLAAQAAAFEKEGGFTERLYRARQTARRKN